MIWTARITIIICKVISEDFYERRWFTQYDNS